MVKVAGVGAPTKEWAWSYSKLKNHETCPKRHYEIDIAKNYVDSGEGMSWGNDVHASMAKACLGTEPLPETMRQWQKWVDRVRARPGKLLVEQKWAITRDFRPTTYFAKDVWFRAIGDTVNIDGSIAIIGDWKTGKVLEDPPQLMLTAMTLFSHYPELKRVGSEFVWLKEDCTTPEMFDREECAEQMRNLMPKINALEVAHKTQTYPPKPGGLCKRYCPVQSCPFHGKGARG